MLYLLAFLLGIFSVYFLQATKWLADRGISPDGPTDERRNAMANGYNGFGPIKGWRERQNQAHAKH